MKFVGMLLLALLFLQDPSDKVRALVEKLGSDEIAERQKAAGDLVKLGTPALPALRVHLGKAEGEAKVVLQSIVTKLEREERLYKLLESPPVVTLKVRDAEIETVLEVPYAELSRPDALRVEHWTRDGATRPVYFFDWHGESIWGATARILKHYLDLLHDRPSETR